jgi:transcription initiation factor TFIIH subunit 4
MAMLYMPTPFASADLNAWFRTDDEATKTKRDALYILEKLHVTVLKKDAEGHSSHSLHPGFSLSLRQALEGSGSHRSFGVPSNKPDAEKVSIQFLDDYAQERWEGILFYMVASAVDFKMDKELVGKGTKDLLLAGNFVVRSMAGGVDITSTGFSMLLKDTNAQVWSLLIEYLRYVENSPKVDTPRGRSFRRHGS